MANFLEHLGLGFALESEEMLNNLMGMAIEKGKPLVGYHGKILYINHHIGWAQIIVKAEVNEEKQAVEVLGFDTHADGNSNWTVRLHEMHINDEKDKHTRRCMVTGENGKGMTVVNIVNADILPSFAKNEIYRLQMIAFPTEIHYYADEEAYEQSVPEYEKEKKFLIGEGAVIPIGFLSNHMVGKDGEAPESNPEHDDIVAVRGVVKRLHYGYLNEDDAEEKIRGYLRCIIDTEYGELEIDHGFDVVDEEERDNIRVGSTVSAYVVLSGDPANKEYENGIVRDFDHNLRLLRYTFIDGDPERLRIVMSDNVEYSLDSNGKNYIGKDEIINRIRYVQENGDHDYYAHMATIISIDGEVEEGMYPVGTRCLVLTTENEHEYESIAFMEVDEEGYITKIHTSMDGRYHFKVDTFEEPGEDLVIPDNYEECMVTRARFHGFHDLDVDEMLEKVNVSDQEEKAIKKLLLVNSQDRDLISPEVAENLFGYLFTKAIEAYACFELKIIHSSTYSIGAFDGILHTDAEGELKEKLEYALKYGKQFLTDFNNYTGPEDIYIVEMMKALKYVHALGWACAPYYLDGLIKK